MVKGIETFRRYFKGNEKQYTIIGGTACDILMSKEGLAFRATKDIDLVLIVEALDAEFGRKLWDFIKNAGYEHCNSSSNTSQFYRFSKPKSDEYPAMIELFTRKLDMIELPDNAVLSPLPIDEEISSLSAILLNDDYYEFLKQGRKTIDGITILDALHLIPFKIKAWIDLTNRKNNGESIDTKNIKKHKNDVFRLTELISPENRIVTPVNIYEEIQIFINEMEKEEINIKQLGIIGRNKKQILDELRNIYYSVNS
ncbi:MAG: hypothetical protein ACI4P1_02545 [Erysipelotrichaceae bacterium]